MGILNCTPDSFHDGNSDSVEARVERGLTLHELGADILDIGGESTRPGAEDISPGEQMDRVCPVIEILKKSCNAVLSVDTRSAEVARAAMDAGAEIINDVSAASDPAMPELAATRAKVFVAMHMVGSPKTMQKSPSYSNVIEDVLSFLRHKTDKLIAAGCKKENIWWDPGIGFGKSLEHNLTLMANLELFTNQGHPALLGVSRKSFIRGICPEAEDTAQRLPGSLAVLPAAWRAGVRIFRVHDPMETRQFLEVFRAIEENSLSVANGET